MNTPFPPPPGKPQRRLWPWFLGGCLLLVLLLVALFVGLAWLGFKAFGTQVRDTVAAVPAVQQNFGTLADVDVDFGAMAQGVMAFRLLGERGEGRLDIRVNPQTGAFESATLTLPNGETRELDLAALQRLEALQQGNWLRALAPPAAAAPEPQPPAEAAPAGG